MKLWAISDLHVGYEENRRAVQALPAYPDDWLIVAGDTGETPTVQVADGAPSVVVVVQMTSAPVPL